MEYLLVSILVFFAIILITQIFSKVSKRSQKTENKELQKRIRNLSSGELHRMVNQIPSQYSDEALYLAKNEIERRKHEIEKKKHEIEEENKKREQEEKAVRESQFLSLLRELQNPEWQNRAKAAEKLGYWSDSRVVEPLIGLLADKRKEVVIKSVRALGNIGNQNVVESLIGLLNDKNKEVVIESVRALGNIGNQNVVESLIGLLHDENKEVVIESVKTLGNIGNQKAIKPFINLLNSEHEIKVEVIPALGQLQAKSAIEPLIKLLETEKVLVPNISKVLGVIRDERAIEPLNKAYEIEATQEGKETIKKALNQILKKKELLEKIQITEKLVNIKEIAKKLKRFDRDKADEILNLLHAIETEDYSTTIKLSADNFFILNAALNDDDFSIREFIIKVLGIIGSERAVYTLCSIISTEESYSGPRTLTSLRIEAAHALAQTLDRRALPDLRKVKKNEFYHVGLNNAVSNAIRIIEKHNK